MISLLEPTCGPNSLQFGGLTPLIRGPMRDSSMHSTDPLEMIVLYNIV